MVICYVMQSEHFHKSHLDLTMAIWGNTNFIDETGQQQWFARDFTAKWQLRSKTKLSSVLPIFAIDFVCMSFFLLFSQIAQEPLD